MRKRTRRKHYTLVNCVAHAIEGARITESHLLNELRLRELAAIESFRTGKATLQDWHDLAALLNVCETMAEAGIGPEALQACQDAETALMAAAKRFESTGKMGLTGLGLIAVRDVYGYHDLQRQSVSRAEYERQIARCANRIKSKAPGVRDMSEV